MPQPTASLGFTSTDIMILEEGINTVLKPDGLALSLDYDSTLSTNVASKLSSDVKLLTDGVNSVLKDDGFNLSSGPAKSALFAAEQLSTWLLGHKNQLIAAPFASKLIQMLRGCLPGDFKSHHRRMEKMWSNYHKLRVSDEYMSTWESFLCVTVKADRCPTFYQHAGHTMFKNIVKETHPVHVGTQREKAVDVSHEERSALWYAAGYIPRALRKKLHKLSPDTHPHRDEMLLCILDWLDDGDEEHPDSHEWIEAVDRGGLIHMNNTFYEMLLVMEFEVRKLLNCKRTPNFITEVKTPISSNEDVQFYWTLLSVEGGGEATKMLLSMIIDQWVTIRGFSYASAWMEEYK